MEQKRLTYGILLASGTGVRFGSDCPKQFTPLAGKTILEHALLRFEQSERIDRVLLVVPAAFRARGEALLSAYKFPKKVTLVNGGATRKESSHLAISAIPDADGYAVIHDCARPLLSNEVLNRCLDALKTNDAVVAAIPSDDTLLSVDRDGIVTAIPNRAEMRRAQTPQCFRLPVIRKAHELARNDESFTDDCGLVLRHALCPIRVVPGDRRNLKVTFAEDLACAEALLRVPPPGEVQ